MELDIRSELRETVEHVRKQEWYEARETLSRIANADDFLEDHLPDAIAAMEEVCALLGRDCPEYDGEDTRGVLFWGLDRIPRHTYPMTIIRAAVTLHRTEPDLAQAVLIRYQIAARSLAAQTGDLSWYQWASSFGGARVAMDLLGCD